MCEHEKWLIFTVDVVSGTTCKRDRLAIEWGLAELARLRAALAASESRAKRLEEERDGVYSALYQCPLPVESIKGHEFHARFYGWWGSVAKPASPPSPSHPPARGRRHRRTRLARCAARTTGWS
jgi:hypothetical protein